MESNSALILAAPIILQIEIHKKYLLQSSILLLLFIPSRLYARNVENTKLGSQVLNAGIKVTAISATPSGI